MKKKTAKSKIDDRPKKTDQQFDKLEQKQAVWMSANGEIYASLHFLESQ